jgi:putative drug exporter of the RND superfamily
MVLPPDGRPAAKPLMRMRFPSLIASAWVLAALAALPFAAKVNEELEASARLTGSESARVDAALQERFKSPFTKIALLRIAGTPDAQTAEGRDFIKQITDAIVKTPGVQGVTSYLDREDTLFLGKDGSLIVVVGLVPATGPGDGSMANLRSTTDALGSRFGAEHPQLAFSWTGEAAVNLDMRRMSAHETRTAELRVLPITLLLLLVAFRSVIAAVLPIVCGALTILISLGIVSAVNRFFPASIIVVSIISMVGLGLSIDYALLIVSRYREGLHQGMTHTQSLARAAGYGGRTVLVSGAAVAIGFGAMLLVPVSEIRSIGLGGLLVTSIAVLIANTLLPVLLAWLGPRVDLGQFGLGPKPGHGRNWRRWATWVARHPLGVLLAGGIPLVLLAAQATQLRIDLPRGRWLPESADSVRVLHEIDAVARGNFGQIIHIVLDLPPGVAVSDESGWRAEARLVRYFARDPRIQHVWAATTLNIAPLSGPEILKRIPEAVRNSVVSADGRAALIELLPRSGLAATDAAKLVRDIRAADPQTLTGLAGTRIELGGVAAFNVDYEDAIKHSVGAIFGSVVCATLLVLSLVFRSALIPLKAVALNLLSVAAAFGAVAVVFQSELGSRLMGLPRPLDGGFPILPVLVFCIVFGLSMDYEVFIVSRIADGRRAGLTDDAALIEGVAGTGRVITFAAAIMIMIFGGFVFGNFVLIKILGFALGVAVLLDATVIRLAVGPAFIQLAGRWNWWPGR